MEASTKSLPPEAAIPVAILAVGIGAIFMAGVLGIIKSMPVMIKSFSLGFREIFKGKKAGAAAELRTNRDIKMKTIILGLLATAAGLFFYFLWISNLKLAIIGVLICVLLSFLFTTVAAYAIAIVGTNPVSGMTLITIILSSVVLLGAGLSGEQGMAVALLIGAVVCTALSISGSFVTDLKIGYWLGATPRPRPGSRATGRSSVSSRSSCSAPSSTWTRGGRNNGNGGNP